MTEQQHKYHHLLVAATATTLPIKLAFYPIERIKLLLPCQGNTSCDTWHHNYKHTKDLPSIVKYIVKEEGVLAFWRGSLPFAIRNCSMALILTGKDAVKQTFLPETLSWYHHIGAAIVSSLVVNSFMFPMLNIWRGQLPWQEAYQHFAKHVPSYVLFAALHYGMFDMFVPNTKEYNLVQQFAIAHACYWIAASATYGLQGLRSRAIMEKTSMIAALRKYGTNWQEVLYLHRNMLHSVMRGKGASLILVAYLNAKEYL